MSDRDTPKASAHRPPRERAGPGGRAGETGREGERVAKVLARAGLCSRREAEAWIADGRVALNGRRLDSPAVNVSARDTLTVDGRPLPVKDRTRLWLYHKPAGLVTSHADPQGRETVFARLPPSMPRVVSVGRLDINTEGLLLLTNDGGLARVLELPSTGWLRRYRVRVHGRVDQARLGALAGGITIDGMQYGPIEAVLEREKGANAWLTIGLREGKNREIKRVLETLELKVTRLIRVSFGPFQLGGLARGAAEEMRTRHLKEQLGARLAQTAGVDFEAPLRVEGAPREGVRPPATRARPARPGDPGPARPGSSHAHRRRPV